MIMIAALFRAWRERRRKRAALRRKKRAVMRVSRWVLRKRQPWWARMFRRGGMYF